MRCSLRFGTVLAAGLALAGCAAQPAQRLPDPAVVAMHEWEHGPPWGPEEIPWVAPPQVLAYGPGYYAPGPFWGPSAGIGLGFGIGRGHWWRGHRGFPGGIHGGFRGGHHGGGHFHGGRGRR